MSHALLNDAVTGGVSRFAKDNVGPKAIPGQIVVKFKSSGQERLTQCAKAYLSQGRSFSTAVADGSASLDVLMKHHQVRGARALIRDREGLDTATAMRKLKARFSALAASKGKHRELSADLVNVYRLDISPKADVEAAAAEFARDPHVEYAHPDYEVFANYTPDDPYLVSAGSWGQAEDDLWGLKEIGAEQAWDNARGNGVVVAVVDTGLDLTHPDIASNIWTNPGEIPGNGIDDDANGYIDDVNGWNISDDTGDPTDGNGHGTHVSGTIAAEDNNSIGIVGVAPDAKIMPVKGLSDSGSGSMFGLAEAILYAAANGADVINNSWGCSGGCPSAPVIEEAVSEAHKGGSTIVFAAGNDTLDVRDYSPQNRSEAIVVSAATPLSTIASFSNFGFIDAAAPGSGTPDESGVVSPDRGILSLKASGCGSAICPSELIVGQNYLRQAGTSMAAPHVSGLAALILSQHPEYSPEQVRQVIRRSSTDLGTPGFDTDFGYGLINASAALAEPVPLEARIFAPPQIESPLEFVVNGTAEGPGFQSYVLDFGEGPSPSSWTTIQTSASPAASNILGTWNVEAVPDGEHTLRLIAVTEDGREYEDRRLVMLDRVVITLPELMSMRNEESISIIGTAASSGMDHFDIRIEKLSDNTPLEDADITLTGEGQSPIQEGVLGIWDTTDVPADHYRVVLEVTMETGEVLSESVAFIVDSRVHDGWPQFLETDGQGYPAAEHAVLADLNGDLRDEQIVGYGRWVYVFKHDGTQLEGWPQTVDPDITFASIVWGSPAIGDVDGDGEPDVVAPSYDGNLWVWHADGTLHDGWPAQLTSSFTHQRVSLADVDGDDTLDIVLTDSQNGLNVLRDNGTSLPGFPIVVGAGITGSATVADLNNDGDMEIVFSSAGSAPYMLFAYSHEGALLPGFPQTVGMISSFGAYPVVGDLDDDGDLEIVVSAADYSDPDAGVAAAYHHTGELVSGWPVHIPSFQMSPPVLSDLDGDGSLEVLVGVGESTGRGALYVWDGAGNLMPGWPVYTPSDELMFTTTPFSSPIVLDVDNDGRSEVIAAREQDFWRDEVMMCGYPLQGFERDGTPIADLARPTYGLLGSGDRDITPGVGDMDGDGLLEMTWIESRRYTTGEVLAHVWDLDTPVTAKQSWSMFKRDARHSGVAESVVPIVELTEKDRGKIKIVNGPARFRLTTGSRGIIQIVHPRRQSVQYALDDDLLRPTPLAWGGWIQAQPSTETLLRIVTKKALKIRINWW